MAVQVTLWKAKDGTTYATESEAIAQEVRNRAERKKIDQLRKLRLIKGVSREAAIIIQDAYAEIVTIMGR